jgi:hypothetical protein
METLPHHILDLFIGKGSANIGLAYESGVNSDCSSAFEAHRDPICLEGYLR